MAINYQEESKYTRNVKENDVIVIRGKGKFIIDIIGEKNQKGRLTISIKKYNKSINKDTNIKNVEEDAWFILRLHDEDIVNIENAGIKAQVDGRVKHFFSIYKNNIYLN